MSFNTLFGKVPEDWTISKIGDIAELRQGLQIASKKRLQSQELGSIPLLKITDLPRKVFSEYVKDIPENYIATKEDIIYTRTGQVGLVYTDVEGCVHNNCFKVILDYNKFDKKYMYYYLNSPQVREYANIIASGSVQKDLTHKAFKIVKVAYPSLKEQKAIADILSSLDEKIELNNQMNETLEEMAQALFKRWFVDFEFPNEEGQPYKSSGGEMIESELGMIPKGWTIEQIGKISEIQNGFAFRADEYVEQGIPVLRTLNIKDGIFENTNTVFLPEEYKDSKYSKYIFEKFDCALVMVGAGIGKIGLILDNTKGGLQNQNMWRFRSLNDAIPQLYLNFLVKQARDKSKNWGNGSAREFYRKDSFSKINVLVANHTLLKQFNELILQLYNKISENVAENEVLVQFRDTLLPKLMSGEIRVSDLKS
ncbi:restriction endonuclease subunit S [Turicibacter sp. TJ11]|uniref:restriction endonuclease subunit S n=1 Tax=Turicibacter sp. TJ11 TaxID=2806443 RepID=UPI001F3C6387|nr:restriction endonuclease subunit S [Turicibacter sp. TJ11]